LLNEAKEAGVSSEQRELIFAWAAIGMVTASAALAGWLASSILPV